MNKEPKTLKEAKVLLKIQEQRINALEQQQKSSGNDHSITEDIDSFLAPSFHNLFDATLLVNAETAQILKVNERACEMYGYTQAEFTQLSIADLEIIQTKEDIKETIDLIHINKTIFFHTRHATKSGQELDIRVNTRSIEFNNKNYFVSTCTDITESKQIEREKKENSKKFDDLVNSLNGIIWEADIKSFIFIYVSQEVEQLLGYSPEEWMAEPHFWEKHLHPEDRDRAIEFSTVKRKEKESYAYEYRFLAKDGNFLWLRDIVSIILDDEGEAAYMRGVIIDITYQKKIKHQNQKNFQKHNELINSIDGIIWEADANTFEFSYVSKKAERMLGYPTENWVDISGFWADHIHPEDRSWAVAYCIECTKNKENHEFEYRFIAADGSVVWLRDIVTVILDDEGEPDLLRGVMVDITAQKETKEALKQSEELYRSLAEAAHEGIWVIDEHNFTTYVNPAMERILGYTPEEMIGRTLFDFMNEEGIKTTNQNIERRKQNINEVHDFTFIHKDGRSVNTLLSTSAIINEEGIYKGALAGVLDITERKIFQEELQQSEKRYRQMFENNKAIKFTIDPETGNFLHANTAAVEFYGYTKDEFEKLTVFDINLNSEQKVMGYLAETTRVSKAYFQFQHQLKSGEIRDVEIYSGPIQFGDKVVLYAIVHDVTQRRKKEKEVQQLTATLEKRVARRTAQLEEINQELEAVAYSISHDLRAPLRAITGYSQILLNDFSNDLPKEAQNYLEKVDQSSKKMDQLIHDLLMLSQLGRQKMQYHKIHLCFLFKKIIAEQIQLIPERHIEFELCESCPEIEMDPKLMGILVNNLVSNALKFTRNREVAQLEFNYEESEAGEHVFSFKDNGVGFDMKYVDKLFTPFQRLHSADEFEGTGIGLAISNRVIQRHKGRLWVESEIDQGTTFYFTIGENK